MLLRAGGWQLIFQLLKDDEIGDEAYLAVFLAVSSDTDWNQLLVRY